MDFTKLFSEFNNKRVLIIGDAMIDVYMWGEINRMSPEAPVPVVEVNKHENRLGGAANVALNLKALGATPLLCSVIGNDDRGILFKELMHESDLLSNGILIENGRKTTAKTRVISDEKQQIRIDEEDTHPIKVENQFLNLVKGLITDIDVIILQDYNKGVLTSKLIEGAISLAISNDIPTIVDPKLQNFLSYKNCTIFKPNLIEIKNGLKIDFNADNVNKIEKATRKLRKELNADSILLTLSERGICINSKDNFTHTPAFKRNIIDVSGAGDTVISVASLCLASKIDYITMSILSNLAAGIVCEEIGVVSINKEKLLTEVKKHINL